jgi:hypothetical protein
MLLLANINDYIEITKMIVKISCFRFAPMSVFILTGFFWELRAKKKVVMRPPLLGVKAFGLA